MTKCSYADKYKGIRAPRCNGGDPCDECVRKYAAAQAAREDRQRAQSACCGD